MQPTVQSRCVKFMEWSEYCIYSNFQMAKIYENFWLASITKVCRQYVLNFKEISISSLKMTISFQNFHKFYFHKFCSSKITRCMISWCSPSSNESVEVLLHGN